MSSHLGVSLVLLFFGSQAWALSPANEKWAKKELSSFWKACAQGDQAYLKRYEAFELEYQERVEKVAQDEWKKALQSERDQNRSNAFVDIGRDLFPHLLPDSFPRKAAYGNCMEERSALHEVLGKKGKTRRDAFELWKSCFEDHYREERSPVAQALLGCYGKLIK